MNAWPRIPSRRRKMPRRLVVFKHSQWSAGAKEAKKELASLCTVLLLQIDFLLVRVNCMRVLLSGVLSAINQEHKVPTTRCTHFPIVCHSSSWPQQFTALNKYSRYNSLYFLQRSTNAVAISIVSHFSMWKIKSGIRAEITYFGPSVGRCRRKLPKHQDGYNADTSLPTRPT